MLENEILIVVFSNNKNQKELDIVLDSIYNQSINNWNCLVVSDNKTKNKKDGKIEYIDHKIIDSKIQDLIKKGIKYLCFISDIAIINKTYLETLYISLVQNKVEWGFTDYVNSDESKNNLYQIMRMGKAEYSNAFMFESNLYTSDFSLNKDNLWEIFSIFVSNQNYPLYIREPMIDLLDTNFSKGKKINIAFKSINQFPHSDSYNLDTFPNVFDYGRKKNKSDKKRILMIFPWLVIGGADKFNLDLVSKLDKNKYEISIILTRNYDDEWKEYFVKQVDELFDLPLFLERKDWAGFFEYIIRTRNVDLVFMSNSIYGYHVLPWLKNLYPSLPVVDYVHAEDWFWKCGGIPRDSNAVSTFLDITYTCTKHLGKVMNEDMYRYNDNIKPIYIGVDSEYYNPEIVDIKEDEYTEKLKDKKVILFVGRLVHLKRPFFILKVLQKLVSIDDHYMLIIVGDGVCYEETKKRAKEISLMNNILFVGPKKDTRPFYKMANITIIASLTEGLSLVAYESLSMGVPVVSSDVGGQKELIDDTCGAIIPRYQDYAKDLFNYQYSDEEINLYVEAIRRIVESSSYDVICKNGRKKIVDRFDISIMVNQFEKEFESLIKTGSTVPIEYCQNKDLYERYLILFNNTFYQANQNTYIPMKQKITNKMWNFRIYRLMLRIYKKIRG